MQMMDETYKESKNLDKVQLFVAGSSGSQSIDYTSYPISKDKLQKLIFPPSIDLNQTNMVVKDVHISVDSVYVILSDGLVVRFQDKNHEMIPDVLEFRLLSSKRTWKWIERVVDPQMGRLEVGLDERLVHGVDRVRNLLYNVLGRLP